MNRRMHLDRSRHQQLSARLTQTSQPIESGANGNHTLRNVLQLVNMAIAYLVAVRSERLVRIHAYSRDG